MLTPETVTFDIVVTPKILAFPITSSTYLGNVLPIPTLMFVGSYTKLTAPSTNPEAL